LSVLRLAYGYGGPKYAIASGLGTDHVSPGQEPAILVSYYYLDRFQKARAGYRIRDWMMDSGAYSAYKTNKTIDLQAYIADCHRLMSADPAMVEVIALDVIGDGEASVRNARAMADAGVPAMPVFHLGDPWEQLAEYCQDWSKVGLSCRFGEGKTESYRFLDGCFGRHWPHRFHSFGWMEGRMLMRYPSDSADSTSWLLGPAGFGTWKTFGHLRVRGHHDIQSQVAWFLELERKLKAKWGRVLDGLGTARTFKIEVEIRKEATDGGAGAGGAREAG
jgi:hypothetical protein